MSFNIFLLVSDPDWVKWKDLESIQRTDHTYVTPCVASGSASLITAQFLRESSSEGLFSTENWQLVAILLSQWHEKVGS